MRYGVNVTGLATPGDTVITTADAKKHLEIPSSDTTHDAHVDALVEAATLKAEAYTNRLLRSSTVELTLDNFKKEIRLPFAPLVSVQGVDYFDADNVERTDLATSYYGVATQYEPGFVYLKDGQTWPSVYTDPATVKIRYTAGYTGVPELLLRGMLLYVGHLFENREAVVIGTIATELPLTVRDIFDAYKIGDTFHAYGVG